MQDRPTAAELLAVVGKLLEDELLPAVAGPLQYRTRVAANLVRIVEREVLLGSQTLLAERDALLALLTQASQDLLPGPLTDQVADLNQSLVNELSSQPPSDREVAIWDALFKISKRKLAIVRPGYDSYDAAGEAL